MNSSKIDIGNLCTLQDLGMAYRKTKVDLFYSPRMFRRELFDYESKLVENLEKLQNQLLLCQSPIIPRRPWTLVPKGISPDEPNGDLISSDPLERWAAICEGEAEKGRKPKAEFRLMEALPVDYHVFSTLWIQKVGHKFEAKLSDVACGNRLRRGKKNGLNPLSLGTTVPYLHPYCKWRDEGIDTIRVALDKDKSVIAITADVSSFYHKLDPSFMKEPEFIKKIGVDLDEHEKFLHELFIDSLIKWSEATPLGCGLPVGLVASALIANVALFELDEIIQCNVVPLYYGRYVDDIILVMENCSGFRSTEEVWDWLCDRSDGALCCQKAGDYRAICFTRPYLNGSEIHFENGKNKVFAISGQTGKTMLAAIERHIQARTSEWRSLPDLPSESTQIESNLLSAIQANGESADSLRKTDKISVRRAEFALNLRDIEAYSRALPPEAWSAKRHAFLDAFIRHVIVLPTFFDFFNYLSRVIELATACADFRHLRRIVDALQQILSDLEHCAVAVKAVAADGKEPSSVELLSTFRENLRTRISQSIGASFPVRLPVAERKSWQTHFGDDVELVERCEIELLQKVHRNFFKFDLASRPLKQLILPSELSGDPQYPVSRKSLAFLESDAPRTLLQGVIVEGVTTLSKIARVPRSGGLASGLLFPTRPPNIRELYLLHTHPFSPIGASEIASCLLALRGFKPEDMLPQQAGSGKDRPIAIPFGQGSRTKLRIAIASWKTDIRSWVASITKDSDPDSTRLDRLHRLVNSVIGSRRKPDYLVMPELSLPPQWFLAFAGKLQGKGISLICGVQYLHARKNIVRNQVWAGLSHDALGFPAMMVYRQDKQCPAQHEEAELGRIGGRTLKPRIRWEQPPVLDHGGFQFALLICSELTNIHHRAALRGNVDALFVPEWNQDTESFNALVESSALDMHAYIIQCNDREHGDSRVRAPYKNAWERDIVRIKGGLEDFYVVGEIDIQALREFQSSYRSPSGPFKPVPDGFNISHRRKTLPKP